MRRIKFLWQMIGLLVLQTAFSMQPILGQDDPAASPEDTGHFQLFPPDQQTGQGQPAQQHSATKQFLRDIWTDQKAIWTSPFHLNRKQFFTFVLPMATGTAGLIATDSETSKFLANTPSQIEWSQRFSNFGLVFSLGFVTAGPLIGGKVMNKPRYSHIGRISAEALVNSIMTNYAIKAVTQRERPDHGNGDGKFWVGGQKAFPPVIR